MRILVVSDLHGDIESVDRARAKLRPDLILSCGDWGDPEQVSEQVLQDLLRRVPVYTTFGNHDPLEILARLKNRDESPVLIGQGLVQEFAGIRLAAIGGIWAKSHAKPHYVTDEDVAQAASRIALAGPVDILITHGCPIGLADLTPTGRHGGQRCFLQAFKTVEPRLHLCGHVHRAQARILKDGRKVVNVGATPEGAIGVVDFDAERKTLEARLERLAPS
jgi:Icc-related predicted phosphoesterase